MDAPSEYKEFIVTIKDRIRNAQYEALKAVNKELVGLYWDIGKMIYKKQRELGWGKSVVENIAIDLQYEFPDAKGFSSRNIWSMVKFYSDYEGDEILQPLVAEISWTHNLIIMTKCTEKDEKIFYIKSVKKFAWSKRVLENQIKNKVYENYMLNQTNCDVIPAEEYNHQRDFVIKDHYTFDFLELEKNYSERELEAGLVRNIQNFLLEMGGDFSFIGSQFKLELDGEEFFIDLLLFHRELRCLVVIELKTGKFKPEYKGKLEFYLNVLNDFYRKLGENESVGIIICKEKSRLVIEYSLMKSQNPIGIASYSTGPELPEHYKKALPTAEQIERAFRAEKQ